MTQFIATIGPASESDAVLAELLKTGLNIARFNTKHNEPSWHSGVMQRVKAQGQQLNLPIQVLLDLQGPEIRINLPGKTSFTLAKDEEVQISADQTLTGKVMFVPQMVVSGLKVGNQLLLADGACELTITQADGQLVKAKAEYACEIKDRKTMNTPGVVLDMPSLTDRDYTYLDGVDLSLVDYVGLSFVRNTKDLEILRQELDKRNSHAKIIAKIENQAALDNIDSLIAKADAIMIARGDLAVETPFEQLIYWQRLIIKKCQTAHKMVITATEMLKSMTTNPRATRAEISDVAHAVYDGTDAVMLSEETAMGNYPVKALLTQVKIVKFTEQHLDT